MVFAPQNTLPGSDHIRSGSELAVLSAQLNLDAQSGRLPADFPLLLWEEQSRRYLHYWSWYLGDVLEEEAGKTKDGRVVYRYPLKINPVRNFSRKHAALLFGEVPDTPTPLVRTLITPKLVYGKPTDAAKERAEFLTNLTNEVWQASNGRSIQYENGLISQFLGGSVFQTRYVPLRSDLAVPFTIRNISPDYFLPIWSHEDYYDLLEAWVVYRIPASTARRMYEIETSNQHSVIYAFHATREYTDTIVDGQHVNVFFDGTRMKKQTAPLRNRFGRVPFVYTPRLREGSFYGSSLVPDISGLAFEFNSRVADEGDAMRKTVQQRWRGRNITQSITEKPMGETGGKYLDIGVTNPALDDPPELDPLDPPSWDPAFSEHKSFIWEQLLREGGLGPIAFGEDEGSQRSALTLAFRMWPSTIVAKAQRTFWTDGLNQVALQVLEMAAEVGVSINGQKVPKDFVKLVDISPDWLPMIPRDREAQVNELILRLQANGISLETALEAFGDIPDVEEEVKRIEAWMKKMAELKVEQMGAEEDVVSPIASSGLRDN